MPIISNTIPVVLTLSNADPTGASGVQSDSLTIASLGCHPVSVISSIHIQDTISTQKIYFPDAEDVYEQARLLFEDMPIAAVKLGFLGSLENLTIAVQLALDYPDIPIVLGEVAYYDTGNPNLHEKWLSTLLEVLIPLTTIITINGEEVRYLVTQQNDCEEWPLEKCLEALLRKRYINMLVTGTHERGRTIKNAFYKSDGTSNATEWPRLPGRFCGAGSTLSAAITAQLANGETLPDAVAFAQDFTFQALRCGFRPGMGKTLPDLLFWTQDLEPSASAS